MCACSHLQADGPLRVDLPPRKGEPVLHAAARVHKDVYFFLSKTMILVPHLPCHACARTAGALVWVLPRVLHSAVLAVGHNPSKPLSAPDASSLSYRADAHALPKRAQR